MRQHGSDGFIFAADETPDNSLSQTMKKGRVELCEELGLSLGTAHWVLNRETGQFGVEPHLPALLGAPAEEVIACRGDWTAWTLAEDRDIAGAAKTAIVAGATAGRLAFRVRRGSGEVAWLQEFIAPADGPVTVGFLRDVTVERLSAEAFATSRDFATMTAVAGRMAHRSANALSVVIAALDLLAHTPMSLRNRIYLEDARGAASEMGSLVRALQGVAFGGGSHPERVDIESAINDAEATVRHTLPENIRLNISIEERLKQCVADPSAMKVALMTMVLNAIDALEDGGTIRIRAGNIILDGNEAERHRLSPGAYVTVAVQDSRDVPGDTDARAAHHDAAVSTVMPSSNYVSLYSLIRHFGGVVLTGLLPDEGAEIRFFLPACEAPEREIDLVEDAPRPDRPVTLLLVDDDHRMRRFMKDWLASEGYDIHEAASGDDAIAMIGDGLRPDLIATDIVMPGILQGTDVVSAAREIIADIPAIFMSAYASDTVVARRNSAPGDIVLSKPFERTYFRNAVRRALAGTDPQAAKST